MKELQRFILPLVPNMLAIVCATGVILPRPLLAETHPNIVFVLFDDMGWGQPQSYDPGSALRTPNLDRLAQQGMRFTDAHSAAAVCTPTRYGLLTGRYPSRIGQFGVLTTYSPPIIPPTRMTVASLLKQHGYHTACVGKWHLGMNWVDGKPGDEKKVPIGARMTGGPNDVGFDYFCGFTHARNIGTIVEQDRVVAHVEAVENQPLMIEKATEYIDERAKAGTPLFLYFPMCPPHTPIVPAPEFIGKSGAKDVVREDPNYGDWVYQGDAMLGQTETPLREATVHQSSSGNLAIRQGPWKLIFHKGGRRELFNLHSDLSETRDVRRDNPQISQQLTRTMQTYIDRGRSTRGADQKNDANLSLAAETTTKRRTNKK